MRRTLTQFCDSRPRRGVRVAEGARLESVFTRNRDVGSNPTLSARKQFTVHSSQLTVKNPFHEAGNAIRRLTT